MKSYVTKILQMLLAISLLPVVSFAQGLTLPPNGANQKAEVSQWMGPVKATFTYNSPDVTGPAGEDRKGKIWGQLVPYGFTNPGFGSSTAAPWRAGANENTTFSVSHDVKVGGQGLPAGTYGFFVAPAEEGPWTVIFSKNSSSWGSFFYDEKEDALRVQATPEDSDFTEWLTFGFDDRQLNSTTAYMEWENKRLAFKIETPDVNDIYMGIIRDELRSSTGFNWQSWNQAANFALQNNLNLEEALQWAEQAISAPFIGQENFTTLQTKSQILDALGREEEAEEVIGKALNHLTATVQQIHFYGRSLINNGKPEKAMKVFKLNREQHPDDNFTTYVGLARGYEAVGKKQEAIKNWEIAIKNLPENQKQFLPQYEAELARLKENK